ncbi:prolyl hydroxylase family protein [Natronospira sp.]|uniref:prolyl hydroxylase family protein n=1 Tax=Natronospira sp. TaxID=2024970 RepID=UPI003872F503
MTPRALELLLDILAKRSEGAPLSNPRIEAFAESEADFAELWLCHAIGSDATPDEIARILAILVDAHQGGPRYQQILGCLSELWTVVLIGSSADQDSHATPRQAAEHVVAGIRALGSPEPLDFNQPVRQSDLNLPQSLLAGLIDYARPGLKPATVNRQALHKLVRDSSDAFLPVPTRDPLVASLERLMAHQAGVSLAQAEPMVVLRYQPGQQYRWHRDYRPPDPPGKPGEIARFGQRVHTAILYLNDDYTGGETEFRDWQVSINPRSGQVLSFPSVDAGGEIDPASIHRGAPVSEGEKWIATLWFRGRDLWHRKGLLISNG